MNQVSSAVGNVPSVPKPKKFRNANHPKPQGFREREDAVKNMMETKGENYFEWLHEKHMERLADEAEGRYS